MFVLFLFLVVYIKLTQSKVELSVLHVIVKSLEILLPPGSNALTPYSVTALDKLPSITFLNTVVPILGFLVQPHD